jgi:uncharacterized membrane protein YfcA
VTVWFIPVLIGFAAGLLGGLLGIGGSVIIIPGMVLYLGLTGEYSGNTQHLIQAAAMTCNVCVAVPAAWAHYRAGAVMPRVVLALIPTALVANVAGVALSNSSAFARQNGVYLAMLLSAFLLYEAGYNAWKLWAQPPAAAPGTPSTEDHPLKLSLARIAAVGLPTGLVAGLLGVGGGILSVPLQQLVLKMPLRNSIANSAAAIIWVALFGAILKNATLAQHGVAVADSLCLAAMLIPTAVLGGYLGARLTHRLPRRVLRLVFAIFMALMAVVTFSRAWATMHA